MKKRMTFFLVIILVAFLQNAFAGRIVVNNDEWALSNTGFLNSPDAGTFSTNVASWFTGGGTGDFLVYSKNFGLTETLLSSVMTNAGNSWEVNYQAEFTVDNLMKYDGIFLAGNPADTSVLTQYVLKGGNVYLAGGTGIGWSVLEAARWNPFLMNFGLRFESYYNPISSTIISIDSDHPIFKGVTDLYVYNGNNVSLTGTNEFAKILVDFYGNGLYAVYDPRAFDTKRIPPVPIPASVWLFTSGLLGLVGIGRKKTIH
ncbi:MAG: hypothetical protein C0403_06045 [Desulfobacterium sp.]|nr:hypothetical protein [Desulfobacterium sp.]